MSGAPRIEPLGKLESVVMELVWTDFPSSAREVCNRLHGKRERAYTTIMTTMDRLYRKGLLRRAKDGLAWRYTPTMSKAAFDRALANHLATEILDSHAEVALSAFVDATATFDEALLDRLSELVAERKRGRK